MNGYIIKAVGGLYTVDTSDGVYECNARGIFRKEKISPLCGDKVEFSLEKEGMGVIEKILPRKSQLIRPPVANADNLVFVCSICEPKPNLLLLDKFIAIAVYKKINPIIVFTKVDKQDCNEIAEIYKKAGITFFTVNNTTGEGSDSVREALKGSFSVFTGNTGVGKSSLINNLFPGLNLETNEISKKLGRGKHTTRHVTLYKTPSGGYIADTPGFSSFDTNRYDIIFKEDLAGCFPEFAPFVDRCRFPDCSHTKEKGCRVIQAVEEGIIPESRHESYVQMYEDAKKIKEWEYK